MRQGEPTKITGALPSGEGREAMETEDGGTPCCWGGGRMGSPRDKEVDCVTTDSKGGSEGDGEALAAGVSSVARPPGRAGPRRRQRLSPAPWTRPPCPAGQPRGCGSPPRPAPGHGAARTCPRAGRLPPPSPGPKQPGGVRPTERSCRDWHPETTGPLNPGDDGRAPTMAECPARTVTRHTGGSGSGLQAPLPVRRKCPDS